jgi:hypothetical protein
MPGARPWSAAEDRELMAAAEMSRHYSLIMWDNVLTILKTDRSKRALKQRYRALRRTYNEAERQQPCDHLLHMYRRVPA